MDTTQIRQLVANKIAGQGTNVDAGSALPDIINGLCDIIDNLPAPQELPILKITEDLSGPVKLSAARATEIETAGILLYDGRVFVASMGGYDRIDLPEDSVDNFIFVNYFGFDSDYSVGEYSVIIMWLNDLGDNYIQFFEM